MTFFFKENVVKMGIKYTVTTTILYPIIDGVYYIETGAFVNPD